MYEQRERFSETGPKPALDGRPLSEVVDYHICNAHRLRAEALKGHVIAIGQIFSRSARRLQTSAASWFRTWPRVTSHRHSEIGTHG